MASLSRGSPLSLLMNRKTDLFTNSLDKKRTPLGKHSTFGGIMAHSIPSATARRNRGRSRSAGRS